MRCEELCKEFIDHIVQETAREPMTLFLSYAHREALICRLIYLGLKARGHKVWFDETNIPHGSNWRAEITKGIEKSSGVLSMISQDAVRPGGVCLDELSIAVGVRGGNIRTVLLEPDVTPPPIIRIRQWLDLTEWQVFKNRDLSDEELLEESDFRSWFCEKFNLLAGMLETRENKEFEGQITTIRQAFPFLYTATSRQMYLLREPHVERTWLREKVDTWLDDPQGESVCIIYGDPGVGKSAFAANYAHYNGRVAAAIFCENGHNKLNSPEAVVETLAYYLACRLEDYREYLADLLESRGPGEALGADELFEVLLATPLASLIDAGRPVECILVDGLDEAGSIEQNHLASVLQKYAERLPRWLRILILSRNVSSVSRWFKEARHLDLAAEAKENREDLMCFVREELRCSTPDPEMQEKAAAAIVSRSEGIFLYAKLVLNAIQEGKTGLEEAEEIPRGLNGIFHQWFQWYFPDTADYERNIRPAFQLMLASPGPLPEEELTAILGWRYSQLAKFKRKVQVLFSEAEDDFGSPVLDFGHLYIREWVSSPDAVEYQSFEEDGILDMAEFFDGMMEDDATEFTEYEALHIPGILERAADMERSMRLSCIRAARNAALMKRQEDLGKDCIEWNRFALGEMFLRNGLQIAQTLTQEDDTAENRKHLIICKNRIAKIYETIGKKQEARSLNEEVLLLARRNIEERGLPEDQRRAAVAFVMIADEMTDKEDPLPLYQKAEALLEPAASTCGNGSEKEEILRNLAIVYNRLAGFSLRQGDIRKSLSYYQKDLGITRQLAMETGKPEARRDLSVSYYKLAFAADRCGLVAEARKYYQLALLTMEYLVKERGQPDDLRGLVVLLNAAGNFMDGVETAEEGVKSEYEDTETNGETDKSLKPFQRALAISRELAEKYGLTRDHLSEAAALTNIGFACYAKGKRAVALGKWHEALLIYEKYGNREAEYLKKWIRDCEV